MCLSTLLPEEHGNQRLRPSNQCTHITHEEVMPRTKILQLFRHFFKQRPRVGEVTFITRDTFYKGEWQVPFQREQE